jgi:hypothetical protein
LLVRTYFGNPDAWLGAEAVATAVNADGFRAYVRVVNDPAWDEASTDDVRAAALAGEHASVLFVVDQAASDGEFPIQVVDLSPEARSPFRCIARVVERRKQPQPCQHGLGGIRPCDRRG